MNKMIVTLFAAGMLASLTAEAAMKIGAVDMLVLVRNHSSYETNKNFLTGAEKDSAAKIDGMKKELEKIQDEGQALAKEAQNPMIAQNKRQDLEKKLVEIQKRYIAQQQAMRTEMMNTQKYLQDSEARFLKLTGDDLRKVINAYAEKNGFDLIFDSSAVPFAKPSYNVTDGVLKEMGVDPAKAKKPDTDKKNEGK